MSASSLSKMRPMAMAVQLLGSSYPTPCTGLRIPLMFQLTTRNMLTANCNAFKPSPHVGASKKPKTKSARPGLLRAHLRRRSCACRKSVGHTWGGDSSPSVFIGGRSGSCRGRCGRLGAMNSGRKASGWVPVPTTQQWITCLSLSAFLLC